MKTCTRCGVSKDPSAFYVDRRRACGLKARCKDCCAEVQAEANYSARWRERHPGRVVQVHREYRQRHPGEGRGRAREQHRALQKALRRGEVVRPAACERCGVACVPHGHHPDYSKPLAVVWVCRKCHAKEHRARPVPSGDHGGGNEGKETT